MDRAELLKKVHARRTREAPAQERRALGERWIRRIIRRDIRKGLQGFKLEDAADLAFRVPEIRADDVDALLAYLDDLEAAAAPHRKALHAIGALRNAAAALRDIESRDALQFIAEWLFLAMKVFGIDRYDELEAQVEELGGLSDA